MICQDSRQGALQQLDEFIERAACYARDRNHVAPGHHAVSRLSPAIRHRLVLESEVVSRVLDVHAFSRVEKFVQEVYWRRYWKSWLALRPGVWTDYRMSVEGMEQGPAVRMVAECRAGNAFIDHFARELVRTGYLHNHARMWFAAWWIHNARLPWQAGADFFHRHLLDGDPASNTLSWRWVAGLQTPGKTYLARRGNIEKHVAPELLGVFADSLADFENPVALVPRAFPQPATGTADPPVERMDPSLASGLWIHEEDLCPENSTLSDQSFGSILVTPDTENWERHRFSNTRRLWLENALNDARLRAGEFWQAPTHADARPPLGRSIAGWARHSGLRQVVAMRPETGPLNDSLPSVRQALADARVALVLIDRDEDLRLRPLAKSGFFRFWESVRKSFPEEFITKASA